MRPSTQIVDSKSDSCQCGRGNGCIGRANNGVIENNVITNMAYYGVFVGPTIGDREGSFSTNVMVSSLFFQQSHACRLFQLCVASSSLGQLAIRDVVQKLHWSVLELGS